LNDNAEFRQLDRVSAEVINEVTGLNLDFTMEGGKVDLCKAIEQIKETAMAEGEKQGFAQGEKHGFAQGEKQGFDRGDKHGEEKGILNSIRNLMDTMSWTAQTAMDALKIPEADRAGYLAKL
jgi:flagellar biosynthesis/type III secretory pathway protein FliH